MAIAKWIPFGATQPVSVSTQAVKPQPVQASSADGKLFGLENVSFVAARPEAPALTHVIFGSVVWQYLVSSMLGIYLGSY